MSKPNWKDAPEWANWFAMDADGRCQWYETKPVCARNYWWARNGGRVEEYEKERWDFSLVERPKKRGRP